MANIIEESERLKKSLTALIESVVNEKTRDCLRTYKAKVVTAPNTTTGKCVVQLMGEGGLDTPHQFSLPYSSAVSDVQVNEMVWVATTYNSWKNAIVWQKINFS